MHEGIGPTIGQRIAQLRNGRMTQQELATAAGVSVDLVRKLEQGNRHTLSISSLHRIAGALDVDAGELLSKTTPLPDAGEHSGAVAIRRALTYVGDLIGQDPVIRAFSGKPGSVATSPATANHARPGDATPRSAPMTRAGNAAAPAGCEAADRTPATAVRPARN